MLLLLIPILGMALTSILLTSIVSSTPDLKSLHTAAAAQSMAIYRQAVINWAAANPASPTQTVPDSSLVFSYGYLKNFAWTNTVTAGHGWVYTTDPLLSGSVTACAVLTQSEYSMLVGTQQGGYLWSPSAGNLNIPVSALIPTGSLIWGF